MIDTERDYEPERRRHSFNPGPPPGRPTPPERNRELVAGETRVETSDGAVVLRFRPDGVVVQLACDTAVISWSDWEFIAKVYGRKRQ